MRRAAFLLAGLMALTLLASTGAVAAEPADLTVIQPEYVDSDVDVVTSDGDRIYNVEGPEQRLALDSADHENVTNTGISDGSGSLEYDETTDLYVFTPSGEGTTTLFWEVETGDGTVTYEASLQVENIEWVHRTSEEDAAIQEDASRFQEIEREVDRLAPNEETEAVLSSALTMYRFFDSPFSTLVADMRGALIMLLLRPGGWLITGFFLAIALLGVASGARYRNRTQKQFGDFGDIQVEKDEAFLKKARQILQQCDLNMLFPDDAARAMREYFGRNSWIAFKQYMLLRSPTHVKGVVLQMMAQIGYIGRVKRDEHGEIIEAWVEQDDPDGFVATDGGEAIETVSLPDLDYENADDRAFVNAVPGEQLDDDVFVVDIDIGKVDFPISNREVDDAELLEELNPNFPEDFEDEEDLARMLAKLIEFVTDHPHTDEWGRSRRGMDILSFLSEIDAVLADEADFPIGYYHRRTLLYIADNMDKGDEIAETVDRINDEGVV